MRTQGFSEERVGIEQVEEWLTHFSHSLRLPPI
jgi:hypothetical protein